MAAPSVSIIIPCHGHAHWLPEAVRSALEQTHPSVEVIIVNDGSPDDTARVGRAWAERHPDRVQYREQPNQGQARARQTGLEAARGEFVLCLDADDRLAPEMVSICLGEFGRRPAAAAVVANAWLVAADGRSRLRPFDQRQPVRWPAVLASNPVGMFSAALLRTETVRALGGVAVAGACGAEDWDLWVRVARCGLAVAHRPERLACYRQSGASHSRRAQETLRAYGELLDRAMRPDERLSGWPRVAGPLAAEAAAGLMNERVFYALGVALAGSAGADELASLMAFLRPGALSVRRANDQLLSALQFSLAAAGRRELRPTVPVDQIVALVREAASARGLAPGGALERQLRRTLANPWRRRSLAARLRGRLRL